MNRREMLVRVAALATAGAATGAVGEGKTHRPDIEPSPTVWRLEPFSETDADVSVMTVGVALAKLGWQSSQAPKPLLCVDPAGYALAVEIAALYGGALQAWATTLAPSWGWAVKWRGRMVGSEGV